VWNEWTCHGAAAGGHLEVLQWARAKGCPWIKHDCFHVSWRHPETRAWVQQQDGYNTLSDSLGSYV
jgi:hypothetical protein